MQKAGGSQANEDVADGVRNTSRATSHEPTRSGVRDEGGARYGLQTTRGRSRSSLHARRFGVQLWSPSSGGKWENLDWRGAGFLFGERVGAAQLSKRKKPAVSN